MARSALFGTGQDGAQNGGLISNVWIGGRGDSQNAYENIGRVLAALGIHNGTQLSHHNHFHIDLRRPDRVALPTNLLADEAVLDGAQAASNEELLLAAKALLDQVHPHLIFRQGNITMFAMDLPPNLPPHYAHVVIGEASQTKTTTAEYGRTIGVCALVENPIHVLGSGEYSAANNIAPLGAMKNYLRIFEKHQVGAEEPTKVTVLSGPTHGALTPGNERGTWYDYLPNPDYYGRDQATFLVEIGGLTIKVDYFIEVLHGVPGGTEGYDPYEDPELCPKGRMWRISFAPDDPSAPVYNIPYPDQWSGLLAEASKVTVTFADLPGEALGQTVGNTITLDADAVLM